MSAPISELPELPDSPSDASDFSVPTPSESPSPAFTSASISLPHNQTPTHRDHGAISNTEDTNTDDVDMNMLSQSPRGNGRVYEFSQDGKLKLKISLKGLDGRNSFHNSDSQTSNASSETQTQTQTQLQSQTTITSQSAAPPVQPLPSFTIPPRRSLSNSDTLVEASSATPTATRQLLNPIPSNYETPTPTPTLIPTRLLEPVPHLTSESTNTTDDDVFSDDISMSELESKRVSTKHLSERIRILITNSTFAITMKFSGTNKHKLHPENLNRLTKATKILPQLQPRTLTQSSPSKRLQAHAKSKIAGPPKPPKPVKRPKPLYSRLMVKANKGEKPAAVENDLAKANKGDDDDEIMEKYIRLSLKDPLSGSKIVTPVRSRFCSHAECFDYESFLTMYNLKPFRILLKRFSPVQLNVGHVDVMKILEDTKRDVVDLKKHNVMTGTFQYKNQMRQLKEKKKQLNELGWFFCPICKAEFNIKTLGDLYVVGEFIDLLQDLSLEADHDTVEDLEINTEEPGKWRWVREEENNALIAKQNELAMQQHEQQLQLQLQQQHMALPSGTNNLQPSAESSTNAISAKSNKSVEIVLLDSDVEQDDDDDEANNSFDEPLQLATDADQQDAMMQELDALFEEEGLAAPVTAPGNSATVSNAASATTSVPTRANVTTTSTFPQQKPLTVKEMMMLTGGGFVRDPLSNGHAGVVAFRPGVFTQDASANGTHHPARAMFDAAFNSPFNSALPSPFGNGKNPPVHHHPPTSDNTPVFMTGDGAPDDPIVLD